MLRMCVQANHYLRETGRNAYNSAVKNVRVGIVRQVPCVRDVDHGRKNPKNGFCDAIPLPLHLRRDRNMLLVVMRHV